MLQPRTRAARNNHGEGVNNGPGATDAVVDNYALTANRAEVGNNDAEVSLYNTTFATEGEAPPRVVDQRSPV